MKTPKEKAEQLVRKYYTFGLNNPAQSFSWYECKECSLIAVDEIIKNDKENYGINGFVFEYWKEVKKEIEKL
jgi:hypothetical protein